VTISIDDEDLSEVEYYDRCKKFKSELSAGHLPKGLQIHLLHKVAEKLPEHMRKEFLDE
tara:strand:- start:804 stop:980 length:177 start_codon:yes stop_codon:yes gene_type:complete